jgi:hypothetical protein
MLFDLRKELRDCLREPTVKNLMRNDGDIKSLEFTIISENPDSS